MYPRHRYLKRATLDLAGQAHHFRIMTAKVEIYTKFGCPYCVRAKHLLDTKGAAYTEYDVTMGGAKRDEMVARAPGARTVPQIFINDVAIGGSDDLRELDYEGKLDALLAVAAS
jgi:glutaredoxin 3